MGGFGSGRWNWGGTRQTTEEWLRLDVRELARAGALVPGTRSASHWTCNGHVIGSVTIEAHSQMVLLDFWTQSRIDAKCTPVQQVIPLTATGCHYGGTRPWFRCPRCGTRRAILFGGDEHFWCRLCRDLTYQSTREDDVHRAHRRLRRLRECLGAHPQVGGHSPRPPGMHGTTFARLAHEIATNERQILTAVTPQLEALKRSIAQVQVQERKA